MKTDSPDRTGQVRPSGKRRFSKRCLCLGLVIRVSTMKPRRLSPIGKLWIVVTLSICAVGPLVSAGCSPSPEQAEHDRTARSVFFALHIFRIESVPVTRRGDGLLDNRMRPSGAFLRHAEDDARSFGRVSSSGASRGVCKTLGCCAQSSPRPVAKGCATNY